MGQVSKRIPVEFVWQASPKRTSQRSATLASARTALLTREILVALIALY